MEWHAALADLHRKLRLYGRLLGQDPDWALSLF
jgi:hypothetical protein